MSHKKGFIIFHNAIYHIAVLIVVASSISPLVGIGSNQPQIIMAQQQQQQSQVNQTSSFDDVVQQRPLGGISFQIDNVTFSHHMASVNGIQMHYVIGG
jgi:hypothetical protein